MKATDKLSSWNVIGKEPTDSHAGAAQRASMAVATTRALSKRENINVRRERATLFAFLKNNVGNAIRAVVKQREEIREGFIRKPDLIETNYAIAKLCNQLIMDVSGFKHPT